MFDNHRQHYRGRLNNLKKNEFGADLSLNLSFNVALDMKKIELFYKQTSVQGGNVVPKETTSRLRLESFFLCSTSDII